MKTELPGNLSLWDERCMKSFIEQNASAFRVFASRYVDDEDTIDDFLQEAYIRLWTNRERIGEVGSVNRYFYSILYHIILDKQSYLPRKDVSLEESGPLPDMLADEPAIFQHIVETESTRLIAQALMKLTPQRRKVILLSLQGRSQAEIGDLLGITVSTVKSLKYNALSQLSELLSKDDFFLLILLLSIR